jgi:uncharacterized protein (DUF2235 family)
MKRIAIFADGTWNSPEKGGATNVLRMTRAVMPESGGAEQVAFYDWGVGTDRKQLMGGLSGVGIDKNIMDCYRFIVHNYDEGDQLFFFGFSRGAYTVRSLAGFIRNCGLLQRPHAHKTAKAFRLYRKRTKASGPNESEAASFRKKYAVADITPIEFVGAWDTVGSLGIPVPFWGTLNDRKFLFHDTEPSKIVQHARHAVSIDENREDFKPVLWSDKPNVDVKQVWFAGVHSDVGGGYKNRGLSDCASSWMVAEAAKCGLQFESHFVDSINPKPSIEMHNARKGIYMARDTIVRKITGPVHSTVKERWDRNAHKYREKCKPLKQLLASVGGDWSKIEVVD